MIIPKQACIGGAVVDGCVFYDTDTVLVLNLINGSPVIRIKMLCNPKLTSVKHACGRIHFFIIAFKQQRCTVGAGHVFADSEIMIVEIAVAQRSRSENTVDITIDRLQISYVRRFLFPITQR